jgi:radical SAM protein with 4Fe4S-binding SPASM domain
MLDAAALDLINNRRQIALRSPWYERTPLRTKYPEHFRNGYAFSNHPDVRIVPNFAREQQLGAGPGMTFPCKSPWTFAKILPDGVVQLCYRFPIGNLHEQTFEKIWFGEQAEAVRQQVAAERELCEACDYFRFCLNGAFLDGDNVQSYLAGALLEGVDDIDFTLGTMPVNLPQPPVLIETLGTFNIVRFKGAYIGVPHALGPTDLSKQDLSQLPGLIMAATLHEARRQVQAAL